MADDAVPRNGREAAWFAVHDALPAFWMVGPVTYDPGLSAFSVTARAPHPGRGKIPVTLSGSGDTEMAALADLHNRLTGMPRPADDAARRAVLNRKLRQAFYQGAEEQAANEGRQLTSNELQGVVRRYPGDI